MIRGSINHPAHYQLDNGMEAIDDKGYMGGKELTDAIEVKLPTVMEWTMVCLPVRTTVRLNKSCLQQNSRG